MAPRKRDFDGAEEGQGKMWIAGLLCVLGIIFLAVCLRGFHAALRQNHTVWTVLLTTEEHNAAAFPPIKSTPGSFHKAA